MLRRLLKRDRHAETADARRRDFVERFRAAVQEVAESDILKQLSAGYGVKSAVGSFVARFGGVEGFLAQPLETRRGYLEELDRHKRELTGTGQVEAVGHGLFKTALTPLCQDAPDRALFRELMEILALLSPRAAELIPRQG